MKKFLKESLIDDSVAVSMALVYAMWESIKEKNGERIDKVKRDLMIDTQLTHTKIIMNSIFLLISIIYVVLMYVLMRYMQSAVIATFCTLTAIIFILIGIYYIIKIISLIILNKITNKAIYAAVSTTYSITEEVVKKYDLDKLFD